MHRARNKQCDVSVLSSMVLLCQSVVVVHFGGVLVVHCLYRDTIRFAFVTQLL